MQIFILTCVRVKFMLQIYEDIHLSYFLYKFIWTFVRVNFFTNVTLCSVPQKFKENLVRKTLQKIGHWYGNDTSTIFRFASRSLVQM